MAESTISRPYKAGIRGSNLVYEYMTNGTVETVRVPFRDLNGTKLEVGILSCIWGGGSADLLYLITGAGHAYQLNNGVTNPTNYWTVTFNSDYTISVSNTATTKYSAIRLYAL